MIDARAHAGFEEVAGPDARVLILGTLPSAVSLATGQYYAQPSNAFWHIMEAIAGAGPDLPYEPRRQRLIEQRLAIWDVCAKWTSVPRVILPSTSPAHAPMPLARKVQIWRSALTDREG